MRTKLTFLLSILFFAILPVLAFAQEVGAGPAKVSEQLGDIGLVIGPLMILGAILKNAFPSFPNRFIPLLTLVVGVPLYVGVSTDFAAATGQTWITAFLVALSATGIHSGLKNTFQDSNVGQKITSLITLVLFLSSVVLMTGCNSVPKGIVTVTGIVDRATQTWAKAHVDGRTTPELDAQFKAAHALYREAAGIAATAYETAIQNKDKGAALSALKAVREAAGLVLDAVFPVEPNESVELQTQLAKAQAP
jgi:hypothetical protein